MPLRAWAVDVLRLLLAAVLSGLAAWALYLDRLAMRYCSIDCFQLGHRHQPGAAVVRRDWPQRVPEVEELTATFTRRFSRR